MENTKFKMTLSHDFKDGKHHVTGESGDLFLSYVSDKGGNVPTMFSQIAEKLATILSYVESPED